jgi:hypothetical protein
MADTYRITRHEGDTATCNTSGTLIYSSLDGAVAFKFYSLALLRHTLERMQENQHARLHRDYTPTKRKILVALDSLYRVTE